MNLGGCTVMTGDILQETASLDAKISYKKAADYWDKIDPTVDGMLGGFGKISQVDIEGSSKLVKTLFKVGC